MRFESWYFLFLIPVFLAFYRFWNSSSQSPSVQFPIAVASEAKTWPTQRILLVVRYLAVIYLLVAFARPQTSYRSTERTVQGTEIMLVMDVSASMNIEDLDNQARFDVAKATMKNFVTGRTNDRIGFVVFSGEPATMVPPTLDYGLVLKAIDEAKSGVLKDGTAIGDGLSLAVGRLRDSKAKSRTIILLTDGENNVGQVDPQTAGELAKGYGIRVYTIAIGTEGRVKLPIRTKGIFGEQITYQWFDNALNPTLLKQIAAMTDGKFYRVQDSTTLQKVFSEIDQLEKTDIKAKEHVRYSEYFHVPLLIGLLLLMFEQVARLTFWRTLP